MKGRPRSATHLILLAAATLFTRPASAQQSRAPQLEARVDYIDGRTAIAQGGLGLTIPASTYTRLTLLGAVGTAWRDGDSGTSARVDATARFVLDPAREQRWSFYGGGGVSALYDPFDDWRALVTLFAGLEGPRRGRLIPALEAGLGGGVRVGVVLRRARPNGR